MNQGKNKNQITTSYKKKNNSVLNVYIYTLKKQKGHTHKSQSQAYMVYMSKVFFWCSALVMWDSRLYFLPGLYLDHIPH